MNHTDVANLTHNVKKMQAKRLAYAGLLVLAAVGMSACGNKEKKPGQALVSVNGDEITVLQLNEEMQRSGVQAAQQEAARKQLLEALVDRQLLQSEAAKDKTDRDPAVMQSIERAKALIIAQAYLQKRVGTIAKPGKAEVEAYFTQHPEFFSQRKVLDLRQLVFASADMNDQLKAAIDGAKSLEEVSAWLEAHNVKFARAQVSRSSADLPPELSRKLLSMSKGQLFIVREGERSLLNVITDVKDSPVALDAAAPQIEQFLMNKKSKEAAAAELARLRASAKIEYFNKDKAGPAAAEGGAGAAPVAAPAATTKAADESTERGAAGLK